MKYQEDDFQTNTEPKEFRPYGFYSIQKSQIPVYTLCLTILVQMVMQVLVLSLRCLYPSRRTPKLFLWTLSSSIFYKMLGQLSQQVIAGFFRDKQMRIERWDIKPSCKNFLVGMWSLLARATPAEGGDNYRKFFSTKKRLGIASASTDRFCGLWDLSAKNFELYPTEEALTKHLLYLFLANWQWLVVV